MYISPEISPTVLWLLAGALVCMLMLACIYFFRVRTLVSYRRHADSDRAELPDSAYLPVSVVIYSQGDADNLDRLLRAILAQDYPAAYEVIVVNEGESADVRDAVSMLRANHHNLYLTFTPEGVVNLSRKKLALTLGIKAARYDIVALTTTAVEIETDQWLRRIMSNFDADGHTEVVLGFATVDPEEDTDSGRRTRAFDYVADSARWLSVAAAGKPFRGSEYNIAYRKDTFLRNKGFARTLNLCSGDDDIFIREIARGNNTRLELSDDSMVRLRHGNHPRIFGERRQRRYFTEGHIRRRPRLLWSLTGWLQLVALGLCVAAAIVDYPNMAATVAGIVLIACICLLDIYFWRGAMTALKSRPLRLSLPWLSATYPLRRLMCSIRNRFGRQKKYSWE